MDKRELTCIGCPLGCQLTVTINGDDITVEGNTCKRGAVYAKKEVTAPTRIVTSSVQILGGEIPRVSVKTAGDILFIRGNPLFGENIKKKANDMGVGVSQHPVEIPDIVLE